MHLLLMLHAVFCRHGRGCLVLPLVCKVPARAELWAGPMCVTRLGSARLFVFHVLRYGYSLY